MNPAAIISLIEAAGPLLSNILGNVAAGQATWSASDKAKVSEALEAHFTQYQADHAAARAALDRAAEAV